MRPTLVATDQHQQQPIQSIAQLTREQDCTDCCDACHKVWTWPVLPASVLLCAESRCGCKRRLSPRGCANTVRLTSGSTIAKHALPPSTPPSGPRDTSVCRSASALPSRRCAPNMVRPSSCTATRTRRPSASRVPSRQSPTPQDRACQRCVHRHQGVSTRCKFNGET